MDYKGEHIDCFGPGNITIRLLLLLWTGDHVAQCEVCKSKGAGGKNACRRCKLKGTFKLCIIEVTGLKLYSDSKK